MIIYQFKYQSKPSGRYIVYETENVEDKNNRKQIAIIDSFLELKESEYLFPSIWYPEVSKTLFSKENNYVRIKEGRLLIEEFLNGKLSYRIHEVVPSKDYPEILLISFEPEHIKEVVYPKKETLQQKHFFFSHKEAIDFTIQKLTQNIVMLARE